LSEKEAKRQGIAYRLFKIPMNRRNARHDAVGNTRILKASVEIEGEHILGFTALGVGGRRNQ